MRQTTNSRPDGRKKKDVVIDEATQAKRVAGLETLTQLTQDGQVQWVAATEVPALHDLTDTAAAIYEAKHNKYTYTLRVKEIPAGPLTLPPGNPAPSEILMDIIDGAGRVAIPLFAFPAAQTALVNLHARVLQQVESQE